ncbi:MAG: hypothetical protein JSU63_04975 [Phycisphaerales bacterium]|nr:MAG: hypothetical protein JSU63_04975 [Phycisphaerales bacterium]
MSLTFTQYDAEDDDQLLKYFVPYAALPRLLQDHTLIILGGKGAGKTALAKRFSELLKHYIAVRADNLNLQALIECVEPLLTTYSIDQRAVITAWRHLFSVLAMDAVCASENEFLTQGAQADEVECMREYLRTLLDAEVGTARESIGYTLQRIFAQLSNILERYDLQERPIPEAVLSSFPTKTKASAAALEALKRTLRNTGIEVLIVVDGFDRFLDRQLGRQYDLTAHIFLRDLLISLLFAARDIARDHNLEGLLHPKILFPADKLPTDHRDFVKVAEFVDSITWTDRELFLFLCTRVARDLNMAFRLDENFNAPAIWARVFRGSVSPIRRGVRQPEQKVFEFLLRHSHSRPRDLLILCRNIVQQAVTKSVFSSTEIDRGVQAGTLELYTFFGNEYGAEHPYIIDLVECFRGCDSVFEYDDTASHRFRNGLQHIRTRWPEPPWGLRIDEQYAVDVLVNVGFLGRVLEGQEAKDPCRRYKGNRYATVFAYQQKARLIVEPKQRLCIHPMFYQALDIHELPEYIVGPISNCG